MRKLMTTAMALFIVTGLSLAGCDDGGGPGNNVNNTDVCEGVQCGTHAHCDGSTGSCVCDDGYSGDATSGCTQDSTDQCPNNYCNGHGTCSMTGGTPVCTCETGYTGTQCNQCDTGYIADPADIE